LIVDADAVLAVTIGMQLFQAIARRRAKIVKPHCCIKLSKFSQRRSLDVSTEFPNRQSVKQPLRIAISETQNHFHAIVTRRVIISNLKKPNPGARPGFGGYLKIDREVT
ncbi:MAG TPA: hypothetical protein VHS31_18820, partial [Tepidisphaeraceae bacterium]|nr:hypothetical protein [Tepidisphaeraceae bacterium]